MGIAFETGWARTVRRRARVLAMAVADAFPSTRPSLLGLLGTVGGLATLGISPAALADTYYVNTTADPGPGGTLSLRQAVALASQDQVSSNIYFDDSLIGSTITLAQGSIAIQKSMQIAGFAKPGALSITGQDASRIFEVDGAQSVTISRLTLTHGHSSGCGGAVYAKGQQILILQDLVITDSTAASGGALCAVGAQTSFSLKRSRVSGNSAAYGGGVYVGQGAYLGALDRSTISGNTALRAGGGVFLGGVGSFKTYYSLIAHNTVPPPAQYSYPSQGGGMVASGIGGGLLIIVASTIAANNSYAAGAALRILDATSGDRTILLDVTVADNASGNAGAAISAAGTPRLYNTLVANNPGGDVAGTITANYSLIKDAANAQVGGNHNIIGADPLLSPLADHGGGTFTMLPAANSPAVNGGFDLFLGGAPTHDQRGYPFAGKRDIGAVERQQPEDIVFRDAFDPSG